MPFKPGQSGNPRGRPRKENSLTAILEQLGDLADVSFNGEQIPRKRALAEAIWQKAIVDKDLMAIKYIFDRVDGTPIQAVELTGEEGKPIGFRLVKPGEADISSS